MKHTVILLSLLWQAASAPTAQVSDLDQWLSKQIPFAEQEMRKNIGTPSNPSIPAGAIVASPSTSNPNYLYMWIRDSAITSGQVIDSYIAGTASDDDLKTILSWVKSQQAVQHVDNPSGGFATGGLGEPKFYLNGTAYLESWGRPQRDGPALRASAIIKFAAKYKETDTSFVKDVYPSVKADLDYVATNWGQSSFDLWEEKEGQHLWTIIACYRAMRDGAYFAKSVGDSSSAASYSDQATKMIPTINSFWNQDKKYLTTGLDCGTVLASVYGSYAESPIYTPSASEVLATTDSYINSFAKLYAINSKDPLPLSGAVAIGRYSEDVYNGSGTSEGNPWFICTSTVASVLYKAAQEFKTVGKVKVDDVNNGLMQRITYGKAPANGEYDSSSQEFKALIKGMTDLGDGFLGVVKQFAGEDGHLSEQFSRNDGTKVGARDLTWSYQAFLEAAGHRKQVLG